MKNAKRAMIFFILLLSFNYLAGRILNIPQVADLIASWNLSMAEYLIATQVIFILFPCLLYFVFTRENMAETLSLRGFSFKELFIAVIIGLLSQPVAWFYSYLSSLFFENQVVLVLDAMFDYPLWLLLLVIAVVPSIVEEIAFRGIVLHGFKNLTLLKASLITGLLFGILHLNLQQFLYAAVLGTIFAAVVRVTGSIYLSMLCHFIVNGSQALMVKLVPLNMEQAAEEGASAAGTPATLVVLVVLLLISIGATAIIVKLLKALSK